MNTYNQHVKIYYMPNTLLIIFICVSLLNLHNNPKKYVLLLSPLYGSQHNWCHLGPVQFLLSFRWPYPGPHCAVDNFSVVKGFVNNRYWLIIIRIGWPLRSLSPHKMMKTFTAIFPAPTRPRNKSWLRNALVSKHISPYPKLTVKLSQWPLGSVQCSYKCSGSLPTQSHPLRKLPYNILIHCLYGAACLVVQSQNTISVQWALFVPSLLRHPH